MKKKLSELNKEEFNNFHENKVHGDALKPFAKYSMVIGDKMPSYAAHWHDEMEIIKVQKGSGSVCIDDKWFSVHEGDILFVNPKIIHSFARFKKEEMFIESIVFNLHSLESTNADYEELSVAFFSAICLSLCLPVAAIVSCSLRTFLQTEQ